MGKEKKRKRKHKKAKQARGTKVILMPADGSPADEKESEIDEEDESGMYLEKEDLKIIYNALREYKPTEEEEQLYELLLESFEEILVCDYGEPMPGVN